MADDYYKRLGVSRTATDDEIAKAYRKLARKYHPDLNPDDASAKKRFQEIQNAYDTLNDAEKRKMYDQFGEDYVKVAASGGGNPFGGGGNPFGGGGGAQVDFGDLFGQGRGGRGSGGGGGFDFEDILRQFGGGGGTPGGGRSRRGQPAKGGDLAAEITVPLKLAVNGGKTTLQLDRGNRPESLEVSVPIGIRDGKKIRLRGQGQQVPGGNHGDLLLTVHIASDANYRIVGDNLELKLPISVVEAAGGATIDVPTPGGTVGLKIPPNSSSGRRLRVRGQGMPKRAGEPGDLYIELQIKMPESLDEQQLEAIAGIESAYHKPLRDQIVW